MHSRVKKIRGASIRVQLRLHSGIDGEDISISEIQLDETASLDYAVEWVSQKFFKRKQTGSEAGDAVCLHGILDGGS